jgi:hypothetical protein
MSYQTNLGVQLEKWTYTWNPRDQLTQVLK